MLELATKFFKIIIAFVLLIAILSFTVLTFYGLFPIKYEKEITAYCKEYGVDETLVYALVKAESNFDEKALSDAGAKGLMQLTDETFIFCTERLGFSETPDIFDVQTNLRSGIWYLSYLLEKYDGNTKNAIAAYNAGFRNVDKWLSSEKYSKDGKTLDTIPFGETQRHVEKIIRYRKIYSVLY